MPTLARRSTQDEILLKLGLCRGCGTEPAGPDDRFCAACTAHEERVRAQIERMHQVRRELEQPALEAVR